MVNYKKKYLKYRLKLENLKGGSDDWILVDDNFSPNIERNPPIVIPIDKYTKKWIDNEDETNIKIEQIREESDYFINYVINFKEINRFENKSKIINNIKFTLVYKTTDGERPIVVIKMEINNLNLNFICYFSNSTFSWRLCQINFIQYYERDIDSDNIDDTKINMIVLNSKFTTKIGKIKDVTDNKIIKGIFNDNNNFQYAFTKGSNYITTHFINFELQNFINNNYNNLYEVSLKYLYKFNFILSNNDKLNEFLINYQNIANKKLNTLSDTNLTEINTTHYQCYLPFYDLITFKSNCGKLSSSSLNINKIDEFLEKYNLNYEYPILDINKPQDILSIELDIIKLYLEEYFWFVSQQRQKTYNFLFDDNGNSLNLVMPIFSKLLCHKVVIYNYMYKIYYNYYYIEYKLKEFEDAPDFDCLKYYKNTYYAPYYICPKDIEINVFGLNRCFVDLGLHICKIIEYKHQFTELSHVFARSINDTYLFIGDLIADKIPIFKGIIYLEQTIHISVNNDDDINECRRGKTGILYMQFVLKYHDRIEKTSEYLIKFDDDSVIEKIDIKDTTPIIDKPIK